MRGRLAGRISRAIALGGLANVHRAKFEFPRPGASHSARELAEESGAIVSRGWSLPEVGAASSAFGRDLDGRKKPSWKLSGSL